MAHGRDILKMLEYEAKRKPAIAALVANLDNMSAADLATAEVPLSWMRDALHKLKQQRRVEAVHPTFETTDIDVPVTTGFVPDGMGQMRRWMGGTQWLKGFGIANSWLEVHDGRLLWLPETGGLWFDTAFAKTVDPAALRQSIHVERCSRTQYMRRCEEEVARRYPLEAAMANPTVSGQENRLAALGVRVTRF